jgi:hypothetical protein
MKTYRSCLILTAALVLSLGISYPMMALAQQSGQPSSGPQADVPLSFFLKFKDDSKNATGSGNQSQAKNATITVTIEKGPGGSPVKLPVSAMVPGDTEAKDLELCASVQGGKEVCQPLDKKDAKLDLSSQGQANQSASNMSSTPTTYSPASGLIRHMLDSISSPSQTANAQLITIDDTTLNIPITVIVPITLQIQNAQVCATVASSGDQTCNQIVMNPTQTAYTPVDIDLTTGATPTVTTAESEPMQATAADSATTPEGTSDTSAPSTSESSGSSVSNDTGSDTEQQDEGAESSDGETNNGDSAESGDSTSETN